MEIEQVQVQTQQLMTENDRKVAYETFAMSLKYLEKYIEMSDCFEKQKWTEMRYFPSNSVKRKGIDNLEEARKCFGVTLLLFKKMLDGNPDFLYKEIEEQLDIWLKETGIFIELEKNNKKEKEKTIEARWYLREFIKEYYRILNKEESVLEREVVNRKRKYEVDSPEYAESLNNCFTSIQQTSEIARAEEEKVNRDGWERKGIEKKKVNKEEEGYFEKIKKNLRIEEAYQAYQNVKTSCSFFVQEQKKNVKQEEKEKDYGVKVSLFFEQRREINDDEDFMEWDIK